MGIFPRWSSLVLPPPTDRPADRPTAVTSAKAEIARWEARKDCSNDDIFFGEFEAYLLIAELGNFNEVPPMCLLGWLFLNLIFIDSGSSSNRKMTATTTTMNPYLLSHSTDRNRKHIEVP